MDSRSPAKPATIFYPAWADHARRTNHLEASGVFIKRQDVDSRSQCVPSLRGRGDKASPLRPVLPQSHCRTGRRAPSVEGLWLDQIEHNSAIDEFWNFYESEWAELRDLKAHRAGPVWPPLLEMNGRDERDRPVCVNWFDAVAYCKYLERRTGLPVRLLTIEEWQAIAPSRELVKAIGPKARQAVVEAVDPKGNVLEPPTYLPHYYTRFKPDLCWFQTPKDLTSFARSLLANGLAIIADRRPITSLRPSPVLNRPGFRGGRLV